MNKIKSVESAYEALGNGIIEFIAGREWDFAQGKYEVAPGYTSHRWSKTHDGIEDRKGDVPSTDSSDALTFLREDLLRTTGKCIWGLTFTLYPDGKFNIEYDYNKPEWYDEEDEEEDVVDSDALDSASLVPRLQSLGLSAEIEDGAGQPQQALLRASHAAMTWLREATEEQGRQWGLGQEANWNLDLNEGWLRWSFGDGRILQAEVQVIGTYNTHDGSFLWGWDHPSVPEALRQAAQLARNWGETHAVQELMTRSVSATEQQAWEWTALAAQQYGASGAYRGRSDATWVYMAYGPVVEVSSSRSA